MLLEKGVWLRCVYRDGDVKDFNTGRLKMDGYEMEILDEKGELLVSSAPPRSWCIFDSLGKPIDGNSEPGDFQKLFVASPR